MGLEPLTAVWASLSFPSSRLAICPTLNCHFSLFRSFKVDLCAPLAYILERLVATVTPKC